MTKLGDHSDLIAQYREAVALLPPPGPNSKPLAPKTGDDNSAALVKTPALEKEAKGPPQEAPDDCMESEALERKQAPIAAASPDEATVLVEKALATLRGLTEDASVQLVRGVCEGIPGTRATFRIAMLNYVRARVAEAEPRKELFILRGAPGAGAPAWALDRIKHRGLSPEEE